MRAVQIAVLMLFIISGCKYISSWSEVATRTAPAAPTLPARQPCMLALSSGASCRISEKMCAQAVSVMTDVRHRPESAQKDILNDVFVKEVIQKNIVPAETCAPELENWALKTFALGKSAPYDVAALVIPNLQEIKLLIWGGGMMAGFLGDGVGSACMSAVGAGISYAESKQWITCKH